MTKVLLVLVLVASLTGCFYQTVDSNDISVSVQHCANVGSTVVSISSAFDGYERVTCSNRETYRLK